jgi:hypothetical protein
MGSSYICCSSLASDQIHGIKKEAREAPKPENPVSFMEKYFKMHGTCSSLLYLP